VRGPRAGEILRGNGEYGMETVIFNGVKEKMERCMEVGDDEQED
jgi:hypothetical protein